MGWEILHHTLTVFQWLIIARVILSWVSPGGARRGGIAEALERVTDPVLRPISSVVPPAGGLDLSPLVAIFVIYLLQRIIVTIA